MGDDRIYLPPLPFSQIQKFTVDAIHDEEIMMICELFTFVSSLTFHRKSY
jgi:hypothetical protein